MNLFSWLKGLFHKDAPAAKPEVPAQKPAPAQTPKAHSLPDGVDPRTEVTDEQRLDNYAYDYAHASILPGWEGRAKAQALKAQQFKDRYAAIATKASALSGASPVMPWYVPAMLHMMESAIGDWGSYLGNGEHIIGTGRKSSLVPAGRGPFKTFEDGALDALASPRLRSITKWDIPHLLYYAEGFNGLGYFHMHKYSPYLWSGTNYGVGTGKYVGDGVYRADAVSDQIGIATVLLAMGVSG